MVNASCHTVGAVQRSPCRTLRPGSGLAVGWRGPRHEGRSRGRGQTSSHKAAASSALTCPTRITAPRITAPRITGPRATAPPSWIAVVVTNHGERVLSSPADAPCSVSKHPMLGLGAEEWPPSRATPPCQMRQRGIRGMGRHDRAMGRQHIWYRRGDQRIDGDFVNHLPTGDAPCAIRRAPWGDHADRSPAPQTVNWAGRRMATPVKAVTSLTGLPEV